MWTGGKGKGTAPRCSKTLQTALTRALSPPSDSVFKDVECKTSLEKGIPQHDLNMVG